MTTEKTGERKATDWGRGGDDMIEAINKEQGSIGGGSELPRGMVKIGARLGKTERRNRGEQGRRASQGWVGGGRQFPHGLVGKGGFRKG